MRKNNAAADLLVDSALSSAGQWVSALDRSALGTYACEDSEIIIARAYLLWCRTTDCKLHLNNTVRNALLTIANRIIPSNEWNSVLAEVFYWSEQVDGDKSLMSYPKNEYAPGMSEFEEWEMSLIARVVAHPCNIPFYQAGIWDDEFIAKCIADDVDVSMALDMVLRGL